MFNRKYSKLIILITKSSLYSLNTKGEIKNVENLLKHGADVDKKCHHGWTPLHRAALKGKS